MIMLHEETVVSENAVGRASEGGEEEKDKGSNHGSDKRRSSNMAGTWPTMSVTRKQSKAESQMNAPTMVENSVESCDGGSSDPSSMSKTRGNLEVLGRRTKRKAKQLFRGERKKDGTVSSSECSESEELPHQERQPAFAQTDILDDTHTDAAFNPHKILDHTRNRGVKETLKAVAGSAKAAGHAAIDPKDSAKRMVARKLAATDRRFLTRDADAIFLDAQEQLERARASSNLDYCDQNDGRESSCDDDDSDLEEDFDNSEIERFQRAVKAEEARQDSLKAAWITSRYVHRVRVLPKERVEYRDRSYYRVYDANGKYQKSEWHKWLGHLALYFAQDPGLRCVEHCEHPLEYDRSYALQQIERIVIASHGWQAWIMSLRQISRWEDPSKTAKWFVFYLILWYNDYVLTFCWVYGFYIVILNRYNTRSVDSLRTSYLRAADESSSALKLSELIVKHGNADWLDPLEENLGPIVQIQLQDIADFLEVMTNYYEWRDPKMTIASLFFMAVCITIGIVTPTEFSVRIATWIAILFFFLGRPIASYTPEYRHLVSPLKWIYWDIPTDSEWAFRHLRQKAQLVRERAIEREVQIQVQQEETLNGDRILPRYHGKVSKSADSSASPGHDDANEVSDAESFHSAIASNSIIETHDFASFRSRWGTSHVGRFAIFSNGIRFYSIRRRNRLKHKHSPSADMEKELWRYSFAEMLELRKFAPSDNDGGGMPNILPSAINPEQHLEIILANGNVERVAILGRRRDEAFNSVIGFSGLFWQQVQPISAKRRRQRERERKDLK